tara:strand:+ start:189 stop:1655 length:1467 start_codon:yes stop_codon:yes gene_type:complete
MQINNQRIISFFKQHPNLEPETTILKFIDIMENLHENMNSAMNNSMIIEMLDKLKQINSKVDNVSHSVNKITEDTQTQFALKMTEFKKDYIAELNMVLTCNVSDRIAPLLKEQNKSLFDKTNALIQTAIPKNEAQVSKHIERLISQFQTNVHNDTHQLLANTIDKDSFQTYISDFNQKISTIISASQSILNQAIESTEKRLERKIDTIKDISSSSNQTTNSLHSSVGNLLKKFENSSVKGKMSENLIQNIIQDLYPSARIESVGKTKETGDIMMYRSHKPQILIENKLWNRSVVQNEVIKFIRDVEVQKCCGVFLSQNNKITTKGNFEINIHNGNVLIYLHHVNNDPDKIKLAIDIVDHLKSKLDEIMDTEDNVDDTISKETLEYINIEYQNFVSAKSSLIKLSKDFHKKFLKQIDDIKLPSLEDYLSRKYSFSSNKFICEYCNFIGKNQQSKSAHLRGCLVRKKVLAEKNSGKKNVIFCKTETNSEA